MIEMRSDTFTLPTRKMLNSVKSAALGDDVYGEDPTVKKLEELSACLLGKEAGILMPSGTMANLATIMAYCPRGSKLIVGNESDIFLYEAGGAAVCGGILYESILTQNDGTLKLNDLELAFPKEDDPQYAEPKLICIEYPHNRRGGLILPQHYLLDLYNFSKKKKVNLHMDGARIFNAAISLGSEVKEIAQYADSIQFCLSKGLSCPIGSMVVGTNEIITKIRKIRKMLGGGMRQAGVVAAMGIVALTNWKSQLERDHKNAIFLANRLVQIPNIQLVPEKIETNMVFFRIVNPAIMLERFILECHLNGLNLSSLGDDRIRIVTHRGINREKIIKAISIINNAIKNLEKL